MCPPAVNDDDPELVERHTRMLELSTTYHALAKQMLPEVELFLTKLQEVKGKYAASTGLPTFIRNLQRDCKTLSTMVSALSQPGLDAEGIKLHARKLEPSVHAVSHADTQWQVLKRCRSFVAMNQAFQGSTRDTRQREVAQMKITGKEKEKMHRLMKEQGRIEVDVVDSGKEWVAIKALQPERLAQQMTDSGWGWGEHESGELVDEEEWEDVPLAKFVKRLVAAARKNRCEYRVPRVRLVLPNIKSGENEDLDIFLHQLVTMDPLVEVVIEDMRGPLLMTPPPSLDVAIDNLLPDELEGLTETLNLDHTILIDLISDLTHAKLEPQAWQAPTTRSQIEEENRSEGGLMAKVLYPVLRGRKLVCTHEAAGHFHDVLRTVGTATERERGRLIVPFDEDARAASPASIRSAFQALSIHALPEDVTLPVQILSEPWTQPTIDSAVEKGRLPPEALEVARLSAFRPAKLSIFMYGWAEGLATVTSNREVAGQVRTWVGDGVGPLIWRVGVTRNLLAKNASPRLNGVADVGDALQ